MLTRALTLVSGIAAATVATLLVASPAAAAGPSLGQDITIVDNVPVGEGTVWAYETDPSDGTSVAVGERQGNPSLLTGIDVLDTGIGYAIGNSDTSDNTVTLWSADTNTGVFSDPVTIDPVGSAVITNCNGLDVQPGGEIIAACVDYSDGLLASYLGVVAPDGTYTPFLINGYLWSAIAVDPVTGELWAFGQDHLTGYPYAWPVDRATGTLGTGIPTAVAGGAQQIVFGADFDRDGQLFVTTQTATPHRLYWEGRAEAAPVQLATLVPSTGVVSPIAPITAGGAALTSPLSVSVWGTPPELPTLADPEDAASTAPRATAPAGSGHLPATGPGDAVPLALGTALLLLIGSALVLTARARRLRGDRPEA